MRNPLSRLRSMLRGESSPADAPQPTRGELLYQAVLDAPAFRLREAVPLGGVISKERAVAILERIETARKALTSYEGHPALTPVSTSLVAMDWAHVVHESQEHGDLKISMPVVLDGRWIGHDTSLLLDVAETVVVDMSSDRARPWTSEAVYERMQSLKIVATGLYTAFDDSGFHINLPSPFGPAEIRQHDITGSPYVAYGVPATADFVDLPCAYEVEEWGNGKSFDLSITRARVFNGTLSGYDTSQIPEEDRPRLFRTLAKFDPTPKSHPDPHPARRMICCGVVRGRTLLVVRRRGSDVFELPSMTEPSMEEWTIEEVEGRFKRLETSLGCRLPNPERHENLAVMTDPRGYDADTDLDVVVYRYDLEGEPAPHGDLVETHWLDVDRPDRPVSTILDLVLLPQIRERISERT